MPVEISYAAEGDIRYLLRNDDHVPEGVMRGKVARQEMIVARVEGKPVGWLRFGHFWDFVPFLYMLAVEEEERRRGYATRMIEFWEGEMLRRGCGMVMTSTQADEQAQHLYRRLGYRDCGAVLFPGQLPLEVFLVKSLS
jgi:ribosomal protein S18 acetylase RimI-like enzyme